MLNLDQICKSYAGKPNPVHAIRDVSLHVEAGEFVAVSGPSGCGKTTVLLAAGGLLQPDSGRVMLAKQDPYQLSANERAAFRASTIGFVFQQFHLVPYLNVLDNVQAPALASSSSRQDTQKRATELLEQFGLTPRMQHLPAELSSGERQRTALARALLNRPQVMLADEPTGNLDHENAEVVLAHLKEFAARGGAVLLVTHDDRAISFADRTVHLRDGQIVVAADPSLSGAT